MSRKSTRIFSSITTALMLCAGAATAQTTAPAAAQADPLQWLEAPQDARALEWARQETKASQARLAAMPGYKDVEAELRKSLAATNPPPSFMLVGGYALKFERSTRNPHGILSVATRDASGAPGTWRPILDVDALRVREGKPYELMFYANYFHCLAPTYRRCMISLSPAGADDTEKREFDLEQGRFVDDGFRMPASRSDATWIDEDTLLVQHALDGAPTLPTGWPMEVKLWKRGTALAAARTIYRAEPKDALLHLGSGGEGADRVGVIFRAIDYSNFEHIIVRPDGAIERTTIPARLKMRMDDPVGGRIVVQLAEAATVNGHMLPAETILAYDTRRAVAPDRRLGIVYTPEAGEYVTGALQGGIASGANTVRMILDRRGRQRIVTATRTADGWSIVAQPFEPVGTSISFAAADPASDAAILQRTGFLLPTRLDLIGTKARNATLFAEQPAFDASRFVVELKSARSRDGTDIDYFLLRPRQPAARGEAPLLMTGYGAFGISLSPDYLGPSIGGKALLPWLTRGGSLALPLMRGGGERGEAWHQAAIRERRQNSYDDFAAVTEQLIADGFTRRERIGVFGMSNGGLLSAVMGTQRPDLYGAIVSDVPLTDLIRMPHMGMGAAWTGEYGDPQDPRMRAAILRYSPYQNVAEGRTYPPFLVTIATSDNRVGPGHARKLAARLGEVKANVLFLEDEEGGHGVSDPLSRPELMAARMTFLIDTLMGAKASAK